MDTHSTTAKLQTLHEAAGSPSFRSIERQLVLRFGDEAPTHETIRQYHVGGTRSRRDRTVLAMLAWYYGVDLADIDPAAARVLVLLGGGTPGEQPDGRGDADPGAATSRYAAQAA